MKKIFAVIILLLACIDAFSQITVFDLDLWTDGLPNSNGRDKSQLFDDSKKNYKPSLRIYLPNAPLATGRAVVAFPGGGYDHLALEHEGYDWAPFYNKLGIAFIVVKYRMPAGNPDVPFSDACEALRIVKSNAKKWNININDIGVMGSSAGGHLASTLATHADASIRPAFQILFYPVISMDKTIVHGGSRDGLLGKSSSPEKEKYYSNELHVNRYTPPAYIALSDNDLDVQPLNGINYYSALKKNGVPASLYVYPSGGHGWGFNKSFFAYHQEQQRDLTNWLNSFAAHKEGAVRVACIGDSITFGSGIVDRFKNSYPSQLESFLGADFWVMNFGERGSTMLIKGDNPYMNSLSWMETLKSAPDIVIIQLGTNDSKPINWVHKEDFQSNMQDMIDLLNKQPSHPRIYLCYPVKAYSDRFSINDSTITNEIIPAISNIARKNNLVFIDLHKISEGHPDFFSDTIHPNEKGAAMLAKKTAEAILNDDGIIKKQKSN